MESLFDILKKVDAVNFRWMAVAKSLQAAQAQIKKLQQSSPGEYVVFDPRTQQIVNLNPNSRATSA
jgi:hypothetical protein